MDPKKTSTEDGEISSDNEQLSDGTNLSPLHADSITENNSGENVRPAEENTRPTEKASVRRSKVKKPSRYHELNKRFSVLEDMIHKMLKQQTETCASKKTVQGQTSEPCANVSQRRNVISDTESDDDSDKLSLFACGQISPTHDSDKEIDIDSAPSIDKSTSHKDLSDEQKKCLYDMFGEDAVVKKTDKKEGIILDCAQVQVLENSYRSKEPNFLTAFSEENVDLFPVDSDSEKFLDVPSLDSLVDSCLTKRYGNKASFIKSKGKQLYGQPVKMVEKIGYKGQQAARLGLIIQMYIQQSLGNLLQFIQSDDFQKDKAVQQVKDIFAMSTKCLDQVGRAGAFHHIIRRSLAMTDTLLFEQADSSEFSNLPLTGDGVFGPGLEILLKSRKEKKKQIDELIPDFKRKDMKRKYSGPSESPNKRLAVDNQGYSKPSWNNFRIPKIPREQYRNQYSGRGRGNSYTRRPAGPSRPTGPKPAEKADH